MKKNLKYIIPAAVLFLGAIIYGTIYITEHKEAAVVDVEYEETPDTVLVVEPVLRYGFNQDSFQIFDDKVKRNENLSDILLNYGLDYKMIFKIAYCTINLTVATD